MELVTSRDIANTRTTYDAQVLCLFLRLLARGIQTEVANAAPNNCSGLVPAGMTWRFDRYI